MAGLDTPSSGTRACSTAQPLSALDEDGRARVRGEKVGFVFQSFQLLPSLTALENVMLPLELRGDRRCGGAGARDPARRSGLGERLGHYPRQLSGGEQQRVALARAFVTRPSLLFADEPTGNLDTRTGQAIIELLFDAQRRSRHHAGAGHPRRTPGRALRPHAAPGRRPAGGRRGDAA